MTDIHCTHCGEPWDHDSLHEVDGMTYRDAGRAFAFYGCGFREASKCDAGLVDPAAAVQSAALQALSDHPEEWII